MLGYAQSAVCRRVLFARYFEEPDAPACGVCDNCTHARHPTDVSFAAWQVVQAACAVDRGAGRCTLSALADVCRGLGGAQFRVADETGRPSAACARLDLGALGGKLALSRENAERLVVQLLLDGYLTESFHATAYTVNVYVAPGRAAHALTQYALADAQHLRGKVHVLLDADAPAARKRRRSSPIVVD